MPGLSGIQYTGTHRLWVKARRLSGLSEFERDCPVGPAGMKVYLVEGSVEYAEWHRRRREAERLVEQMRSALS